ncbi:exosortase-dependent surface protein XDP1 [Alteromonas sp. BMJM2]|uniref:exosortase-dependent surface protein XDP1 n=1 Tax=Alteromonas sp. BMJM2 TaxID=2954241 RepID=UPI0022B3CF42|nr:exosortase-dependent surface protein XDP1 [Alteromonas sp. BMJM2]
MKYFKSVAFCAVSLFSSTAFATDSSLNEQTYSLGSSTYIDESLNPISNNVININGKDIYVGITGWADTGGGSDDLKLEQGDIKGWKNSHGVWGYGLFNNDFRHNSEHDTFDTHALDNYTNEGTNDFDMFLVSFSEAVTLTGAAFSYKNGGDGEREITVAGLHNINAFQENTHSTWSSVYSTVKENTLGHFSLGNKSEGVFESDFTDTIAGTAQYWLVGAYNTVFDDNNSTHHGVGLKLSSLDIAIQNTQQNTDVSEPGALALMSLGLGLVLYRRKRRA